MKPTCLHPTIASWLTLAVLSAAAEPEFNWVSSGVIDVGDRASEAAGQYEANGDIQTVELAYRGERLRTLTGRRVVGPERFVIRPASWRGGPATAHLVICRVVDTGDLPGLLTVSVGEKQIGEWTIRPPEGERRLFDAMFVIPRSPFPDRKPPGEVAVTIAAEKPSLSLGYRFYATRDSDLLGPNWGGDLAALTTKADPAEGAYLQGLLQEGDHNWQAALESFRQAELAAMPRSDEIGRHLPRLARAAARRMRLRIARAKARATDEAAGLDGPDLLGNAQAFDRHYRLGLLAGAWSCWEDALYEFQLATQADPGHAEATYRLAEAMEYNRRPIAESAPLFERAGMLGQTPDTNVEDILVAVHLDPVEGLCGRFSQASLEALQRDWRYVEQQVYGASLGAWKLRTHFVFRRPTDPEWVMQAGWIFLPPDETVPVQGTYDYSIGTAEYGSSHAGGVDCGVSGSGGAQIGPTRGWEVLLHEWNHEFDWTCISAEVVPGYPVTHDSDGCGKQPIVSMGCGHRSSMRYYINRAQYRRHEGSDPVVPAALVKSWALGPIVAAPTPPDTSADGLAAWLTENGHLTADRIRELKAEWDGKKKEEKQRAEKPPVVKSQPPPQPVPDWPAFLLAQWNRVRVLDQLAAPLEAAFVTGEDTPTLGPLRTFEAGDEFLDLRRAHPDTSDKCVAYARTFVHSPVDQEVRLWLGYNDCAALWLNGRKVHEGKYYACAKWEDLNRPYMLAKGVRLMKGWNCLAAKVERGGGDWGFSAHLVDSGNRPVPGLQVQPNLPAGQTASRYVPPQVGQRYRWPDVKDDYLELLPRLTAADLAKITGVSGLSVAEHRFMLTLPEGTQPLPGSRYIGQANEQDTELNNYLNWDREAAAALRYGQGRQTRDLLLIRPEYYEEFLTLVKESPPDDREVLPPDHRVLGYLFIPECDYATTPNRSARAVLVVDTWLGDYPAEDLDLLVPGT
jgi:hypothetical protein